MQATRKTPKLRHSAMPRCVPQYEPCSASRVTSRLRADCVPKGLPSDRHFVYDRGWQAIMTRASRMAWRKSFASAPAV